MSERDEKALAFLRELDIKTSIGGFEKKATVESLRSLSDIYEEVLAEERSTSIKRQNDAEQKVGALEDELHNCQLELAEAQRSLAAVKAEAEEKVRQMRATAEQMLRARKSDSEAASRQQAERLLSEAKNEAKKLTDTALANIARMKEQAEIDILRRKAEVEEGLKSMKEEKKNIIRELNLIQTQLNELITAAKFPKEANALEQKKA